MIAALSGGEGLGNAAGTYFAQKAQGTSSIGTLSTLSGGEGSGGASQSTSSISGPGQLLSDLQQLQSQNPTSFTQVVSQIASNLQTASQQNQGSQSSLLSSLASVFQSIAGGGSLSQLQPQQQSNQSQAQHAYSQSVQSSQGLTGLASALYGQSSGTGSVLQQLFSSISNQVNSALAH